MKLNHAAKFGKKALRIAIMMLMLLCAATAMAEVKSAVITTDSRIFQSPSTSAPSLPVPGGMKVNLHAVNGDWALVENGGVYAYMYAGHVTEIAQPADSQPTTVYITADTYVYQYASTSAACIPVCAGMKVSLLRVSGDWALVENSGVRAYIRASEISESAPDADYSKLMSNAKSAVITATCRAYQSPSTSSASVLAPAGMKVNLLIVNGSWALIENNGAFAYVDASKVKENAATTTTAPAPETDYDALMANAKPAVITVSCRVYQSPSTSAASLRVSAGMKVNLLAVNGDWALVENGGVLAYIASGNVALSESVQPTPTPEPEQPDYSALMANAKPAVITVSCRVYQSPSTSAASLRVSAGMKVNLLAVSGDWALVENGGVFAYIASGNVALTESVQPTPTPEPEQPDYSGLLANAKDAVISTDTLAYKFADLSSSSVAVAKGTSVRLLAVSDGWALIECNGSYGFANANHVAVSVQPTPTPVADDYLSSSAYSNEEKCYLFITREMRLNTAAASGILANIKRESSFNPASGSSYYGLCQWGGSRLTNLRNYCSANGYSASSLEGQLRFMWYELKNSYTSVYKTLQTVENTADGAYTAGYKFCYSYEAPANRVSSSESRGVLARDTYFPRYN